MRPICMKDQRDNNETKQFKLQMMGLTGWQAGWSSDIFPSSCHTVSLFFSFFLI